MTPPVLLCNTLYRVLTPPAGDVLATLQSGHPRFAELVRAAKMEAELGAGLLTVLAPLDSAFDKVTAAPTNSAHRAVNEKALKHSAVKIVKTNRP